MTINQILKRNIIEKPEVIKSLGYVMLLIISYIILQPNIFGPAWNTFAAGADQHFLLNPVLRYAQEFSTFGDPVVRIWNGEYDIHHNPHMNVHYPFYFQWLGSPGDIIQTSHKFFLVTHFHHIVGGLGAFVLAKSLGARSVSAFAAGLFFALCLNNTYLSPFFTRMAASSWTPWALAAVWMTATGKSPRLGILLGVPAVALLVFATSTQPLLYFAVSAGFIGLIGLYYGFKQYPEKDEFFRRCILSSTALVVLSLCLALPAFLPVITEQSDYVRWTTDGPVIGSYKVAYEASILQAYPLAGGLTNVFVPLWKFTNVGSSFVGPIFGFLVMLVFVTKRLKLLAAVMLVLSIYFIINGLGDATFVPQISYKIPFLNNVRQLTSHYVLLNFAVIILIALYWDHLLENRETNRVLTGLIALVVVAICFYAWSNYKDEFEKVHLIFKLSVVAVPILVFAITFVKTIKAREFLLVVLAILVVLPPAAFRHKGVNDFTRNPLYSSDVPTDIRAAWDQIAVLEPNAIVGVRVKKIEDVRLYSSRIASSSAIYHGLKGFNLNMSPRPHAEFKHFNRISNNPNAMADRGMQYFVTSDRDRALDKNRFKLIETIGAVDIYKVLDPVKRLNRACDISGLKTPCKGEFRLNKVKELNNSFTYSFELSETDQLAFYGFKNNNWSGFLDQRELPLKWAGEDQIVFDVPAGAHDLTFKYKDQRQPYLWIVFLIGLALYLAFFFKIGSRRFSKPATT